MLFHMLVVDLGLVPSGTRAVLDGNFGIRIAVYSLESYF